MEQFLRARTVRFSETAGKSATTHRAPKREAEVASIAFETSREKPVELSNPSAEQLLSGTTGLPNKSAFNEAIQAAPTPRTGMLVEVFCVQGMERINARYGDKLGDEELLRCIQMLTIQVLQSMDRLFR